MNTETNNGWKIILSIAGVAIVLSVVLFLWPSTPEVLPQVKQEVVTASVAPITTIAPVSSIDEVEMALLKNSVDEATLLNESNSVGQLSSDSAALENLGKAYDETTL
ncbi:MAG: hypothetical protein Q8L47_05210 [bacterium]|nr:hypothetical protein [bacterium]